jgi:hypothetical protein
MKWEDGRRSERVEDRRGRPAGMALGGGGIVALLGLAGVVWLLGGDPTAVLQVAVEEAQRGPSSRGGERGADEDVLAEFVSVVLADTERVWTDQLGPRYQPPTLVLFTDRVQSACGIQGAATGPFYCPADHKAYIDLGFYRVLRERLGAPGDFAQAYVLAHEVGHHVQNVTGLSGRVDALQAQRPDRANDLSVRRELMADCYAGVWAHHTALELEPGDVEEGLRAAAAIGDDTLQARSGRVAPETFTHGTSEQRMQWLTRGLKSGDPAWCDTFADLGVR